LAGADRDSERVLLRDWAGRLRLSARLHLTTDAALLLAAGTPHHCGLAVVAGTGSIAVGRTADGRTARAGGWGYLLGDEGSGYRITLSALQAIVQAADGRGQCTALTDAVLQRLQIESPRGLVQTIYGGAWDRAALAGLAPLVFASAEAGDAVATRIVAEAADHLAQAAGAVARQLDLQGPAALALAGGCLLASGRYRRSLVERLEALDIRCDPVQEVPVPAVGAVRLARETASAAIT
jgi:N-acetylglucosamine kinase-like BadF-type ATPase